MKSFIIAFLFSAQLFGSLPGPRQPDEMIIIDTSSNNITGAFNSSAGSQVRVDLDKQTRFQFFNTTATNLVGSVSDNTCDGSTKPNFVIPANNGGNTVTLVAPRKNICLKTLDGTTVNSGFVTISAW